jgi:hypothetical protein
VFGAALLHSATKMPGVLTQMAKYDPLRSAVLTEAAHHLSDANARTTRLRALIDPILARTEGQIGTHSERCYEYHVGCLAHRVAAVLEDEA